MPNFGERPIAEKPQSEEDAVDTSWVDLAHGNTGSEPPEGADKDQADQKANVRDEKKAATVLAKLQSVPSLSPADKAAAQEAIKRIQSEKEFSLRAEKRNSQKRSFLDRLKFWKKEDTGLDMAHEEALRRDAQIEQEKHHETSLTNPEAEARVSGRLEFDQSASLSSEFAHENIAREERLRAKSAQLFEALKNHDFTQAEEIYRKKLLGDNSDEGLELTNDYERMRNLAVLSVLSGGDRNGIRSALKAVPYIEDNVFLTIPKRVRGEAAIQDAALDRIKEVLASPEKLGRRFSLYNHGGFVALESVPELEKLAKETLFSKLNSGSDRATSRYYYNDPKLAAELIEKYALCGGLMDSAEHLKQDPRIRKQFTDRLLQELNSGSDRASGKYFNRSPELALELVEKYIQSGLVGSEAELKLRYPEIRKLYR